MRRTAKFGENAGLLGETLRESVDSQQLSFVTLQVDEPAEEADGKENPVGKLYRQLRVSREEGLQLLPRIETPLPRLKSSLFTVAYKEPEGPRIEFFNF